MFCLMGYGNIAPPFVPKIRNRLEANHRFQCLETNQNEPKIEDQPSLLVDNDKAAKIFYFDEAVDILKNEAKPTYTGFAIGSPGTPHLICASDQIRASWIKADNSIIVTRFIKSSV